VGVEEAQMNLSVALVSSPRDVADLILEAAHAV
jgi:hypothetical protein